MRFFKLIGATNFFFVSQMIAGIDVIAQKTHTAASQPTLINSLDDTKVDGFSIIQDYRITTAQEREVARVAKQTLLLLSDFSRPENFEIHIVQGGGARFCRSGFRVSVSQSDLLYTSVVVPHEIGHVIFDFDIIKRLPKSEAYVKFFDEMNRNSDRVNKEQQTLKNILSELENNKNALPGKVKELQEKVIALSEKIGEDTLKAQAFCTRIDDIWGRDFVVPYSEFFADLVAVLFVGDPDAVLKHPLSKSHRSFSQSSPVSDEKSGSLHSLLDPTRQAVWKMYDEQKNFISKSRFIKIVAEGIVLEMTARINNNSRGVISAKEMNDRLIKSITTEFERQQK